MVGCEGSAIIAAMTITFCNPAPGASLSGLRGCYALLAAVMLLLAGCASPLIDHVHDAAPQQAPAAALSRAGRPVVALVLGGGAARGFAHIGVIQVLEENGVRPDIVIGASVGSFVGALYAGGFDAAGLARLAGELRENDLRDFIYPDRGFVRGERLQNYVNKQLGGRTIEQLPLPFAAVATDLASGEAVAFNRGDVGVAVRASSAIPGVFQPVRIRGREYIDGGVVSPAPVRTARASGADFIIAVDIAHRPDDKKEFTNTVEILSQAINIMTHRLAGEQMNLADVAIRPQLQQLSSTDFSTRDEAIKRGAEAARRVIGRIRNRLAAMTGTNDFAAAEGRPGAPPHAMTRPMTP